MKRTVFISYSHADEALKDEFLVHLSALRREELISIWHDRQLEPSLKLDETISNELSNSNLIILLISANFINSDYCSQKEMTEAFARKEAGLAQVVCVILRPCQWFSIPAGVAGKLGDFVALPRDAKPVTSFADHDFAWDQVVGQLRLLLAERRNAVPAHPETRTSIQSTTAALAEPVDDEGSDRRRATKRSIHERQSSGAKLVSDSRIEKASLRPWLEMGAEAGGRSTGIWALDQSIGALMGGTLTLIAGRPGMGKTALSSTVVYNIAEEIARESTGSKNSREAIILYFSLKDSPIRLKPRFMALASGVPIRSIVREECTPEQIEMISNIDAGRTLSSIKIVNDSLSVSELCAKIKELSEISEIYLVVIDDIHHIRPRSSSKIIPTRVDIEESISRISALARSEGIPILATSSLLASADRREDQIPQASDLAGYEMMTELADNILLIHRQARALELSEPREGTPAHLYWQEMMDIAEGQMSIYVPKSRVNSFGRREVWFDNDFACVRNSERKDAWGTPF